MIKGIKYRIYPNKIQEDLINKHIGASRFIYNLALECKTLAYTTGSKASLTSYDLIKQLPPLKEDLLWLKEINSQTLQEAIFNMDLSFERFFKKKTRFPRYKNKKSKQSFNIQQGIKIKEERLFIPKFKKSLKINIHKSIEGKIKQGVITKTPSGKYYISIIYEINCLRYSKPDINVSNTIGVDLGLKSFLTTSEGKEIENPKFYKKQSSKLKYIRKKYSKYKGKRTKHKLTILHEKIANQRKDFLHKVSIQLIRENQSIALETLRISNMVKNHNLALSIYDVGWAMFVEMLEYKADWYGKNILRISSLKPSSKTCSVCGSLNKELKLSDRIWTCSCCNTLLDRDINAAINIKNFALNKVISGIDIKNQNELSSMEEVMTSEV